MRARVLDKILSFFEGPWARLLMFPALAFMGIFILFPLVWSVYLSFTNYRLTGPEAVNYTFVGLKNYLKLFKDSEFLDAIRNSFVFTFLSALVGQTVLGLGLALVARMKEPEGVLGKVLKILKIVTITVVFISWVIPEVVAGYAWISLTETGGFFSTLFMGPAKSFKFEHPMETIIIANIWRGTAFSMILFIAALESIPSYIYEAAEIDGATPWQRFRYVILPLLSGAILVDLILITIWTFGLFTLVYIILGVPFRTMHWTIYVYYKGIDRYNVSLASAASNIMFLIVLALIVSYLVLMRKLRRWG